MPPKKTSKPVTSKKPSAAKKTTKSAAKTKTTKQTASQKTPSKAKSAKKIPPALKSSPKAKAIKSSSITKAHKKDFIKQHLQHYVVAFYAIAFINIALLVIIFSGRWLFFSANRIPANLQPSSDQDLRFNPVHTSINLDQLENHQPEVFGKELEIAIPEGHLDVTLGEYQVTLRHNENTYELERPPTQRLIFTPLGGPSRSNGMQITFNDQRYSFENQCLQTNEYLDPNTNIRVIGTDRSDSITVKKLLEPIMIQGQQGNDFIDVSGSRCHSNWIDGGWGNDTITGSPFNDRLSGGRHHYQQIDKRIIPIQGCVVNEDELSIRDQISGGAGDDTIIGCAGNDILKGGNGDDSIFGDDSVLENNRLITPKNYNDTIDGGFGNDYLRGGPGDDTINGGPGNDIIQGDSGTNTLSGGGGSDELWDVN